MYKIKYFIMGLAVIVTLASSCTKKFDDVNTDPNKPTPDDVPATNMLGFAIHDMGNLWDSWGDIDEPESYSGHIGKIQYIDESRYRFRTGTLENMWTYLYRQAKSLQVAIEKSKTESNTNLQAASMIMQAYVWQLATDRWRDIPFTEALAADSGKITPAYDKQETIYPALLKQLSDANALINSGSDGELGEGDFLFGGDITRWQKFCNSLRLRMAMRISKVDPATAKSTIENILSNSGDNPIILSNSDNAFMNWAADGTTTVLTSEPWYTSLSLGGRWNNYAVGQPLIDTLVKYKDPRISVYATTALDDATKKIYRGTPIGPAGTTSPGGIKHYSMIGDFYYNIADGYTPLMRAAEVQFILAEAAANGWSVGTTAKDAYNKGIDLSFEENKAAVGSYKTSSNVVWNGNVKRINVQKWLALYKDGHEAWAEMRRTDVPLLPPASGSSYTGHNRPPFRYPYPTSESRLNGKNSAEYVAKAKDNYWGLQMWWDTRTGVQ